MTQWFISQKPQDRAAWPESVPTEVDAAASCDAATLIDDLSKAVRVEGGSIIVPEWAQFQIADHLMHIRKVGFRSNGGD